MDVFGQWDGMAKKIDFFAGDLSSGLLIAGGHHIDTTGGLLHRSGLRSATLNSLP